MLMPPARMRSNSSEGVSSEPIECVNYINLHAMGAALQKGIGKFAAFIFVEGEAFHVDAFTRGANGLQHGRINGGAVREAASLYCRQ